MTTAQDSRSMEQLALAGALLAFTSASATAQSIGDPGGGAPVQGTPAAPVGPGGTGTPQAQTSPLGGPFMLIMIGLLVFMVVSTVMSGRRQKKERAALLNSLNKHDRVQTAGGVIGSIVEIKDAEIVLRVDQANNTRISFSKNSVQQVLQPAPGGGSTTTADDVIDA